MADKCQGTNREGGPCSATPQPGKPRCLWHDPARAAERAEWSKRGGRAKSHQARARKAIPPGVTGAELEGVLTAVLTAVIGGHVEVGRANAAANVARALIAAKEAGTLEDRIAALEARAGVGEGRPA